MKISVTGNTIFVYMKNILREDGSDEIIIYGGLKRKNSILQLCRTFFCQKNYYVKCEKILRVIAFSKLQGSN